MVSHTPFQPLASQGSPNMSQCSISKTTPTFEWHWTESQIVTNMATWFVCVCVCLSMPACMWPHLSIGHTWRERAILKLLQHSHTCIQTTLRERNRDGARKIKSPRETKRERFDVNNDSNENHLHSDSYWSPLLTSKAITDYSNKNRLHKYRSRNRQTESQAE